MFSKLTEQIWKGNTQLEHLCRRGKKHGGVPCTKNEQNPVIKTAGRQICWKSQGNSRRLKILRNYLSPSFFFFFENNVWAGFFYLTGRQESRQRRSCLSRYTSNQLERWPLEVGRQKILQATALMKHTAYDSCNSRMIAINFKKENPQETEENEDKEIFNFIVNFSCKTTTISQKQNQKKLRN